MKLDIICIIYYYIYFYLMEYLLARHSTFGSPFYNKNAGRDHRDFENSARLRKSLRLF